MQEFPGLLALTLRGAGLREDTPATSPQIARLNIPVSQRAKVEDRSARTAASATAVARISALAASASPAPPRAAHALPETNAVSPPRQILMLEALSQTAYFLAATPPFPAASVGSGVRTVRAVPQRTARTRTGSALRQAVEESAFRSGWTIPRALRILTARTTAFVTTRRPAPAAFDQVRWSYTRWLGRSAVRVTIS